MARRKNSEMSITEQLNYSKLIGNDLLRVVRNGKKSEFLLHSLSDEEVFRFRKSKCPSFVVKVHDDLFFTNIPKNMSISLSGHHLCMNCQRCRAVSEEEGGCSKVRDIFPDIRPERYLEGLAERKRIEKYPFIEYGYESFCTKNETFVVLQCKNFEPFSSSRIKAKKDKKELQEIMEQFSSSVW